MKLNKTIIISSILSAVVLSISGISLAQTSDISLKGVQEVRQIEAPYDIKAYDATTESEIITLHDKDRLKLLGMKLSTPLFAAKISEEEAIIIASAKSLKWVFAKQPVYIVTFFDIKGTGHAMKGKEAPTYSQFNVVIDANSGKSLLSFTYR
ncbi:MAG: hypothetical protein JSY10_15510 [Paenibacillus sp.]|nr:hypothetical protein [Paenibacillus sp.]